MLRIKIYIMIYFAKLYYGFSKISTSVIYGQAWHETGNFKSKYFKENNNLFGMRQAKIRKNYATGSQYGFATFKSHFDSIRDYFLRQKNYKIDSRSDEGYMKSTFDSGYAVEKDYLIVWKNVVNTVKMPVSSLYYFFLFFFLLMSVLVWSGITTINNNKKTK